MTDAPTSGTMSPGLFKVAARAKADPQAKFNSLAHLIDVPALERSYDRIRNDAAVGVDGVTKGEYGQNLMENLKGLHERMKGGRYRHQLVRRVHIPKENRQTRPIGVCTVEDKVVQGAVCRVLEAIYEQDFLNCSYGCRPGRGAHDAIRTLHRVAFRNEVNWVLEADIRDFFGSLDRNWLMKMLQHRVADGSLLRLVGKCLHVGVLDGAEFTEPDQGTTQGSAISPLLGNVYLHYALDLWFEVRIRPGLVGKATLVRYCDDFVICFEDRGDAERVYGALPERMAKFGLTLHPDKTRLLPYQRPSSRQAGGKGPSTFDFLGFTLYWRKTRSGRWQMTCKTRRARLGRALRSIHDWCRDHRHWSIKAQHQALTRRIRGHFNYFAVNGNLRRLQQLTHWAKRSWFKWLNRRSQRSSLTWARFTNVLKVYPLPKPQVLVQVWG